MSSGSDRRLAGFVAGEWGRLVASVRSWIDDTAERDAEDIVQDVVLGLCEQADVTASVVDLSAYVYRSLRNRVIDHYRSKRRAVSLEALAADSSESLARALVDERPDAEALLARARDAERLGRALGTITPEQRDVLLATELQGRGFRELSEEWGVPMGTLLARKHRALAALRKALLRDERTS